jgi:hypothetical protein
MLAAQNMSSDSLLRVRMANPFAINGPAREWQRPHHRTKTKNYCINKRLILSTGLARGLILYARQCTRA